MSDDHDLRRDLAFARWWDDLLAGQRRRPPRDVDAELAAFAHRLRTASPAVPASPAFRRQLWDDLVGESPTAADAPSSVQPTPRPVRGAAAPTRPGRSSVVWFAAAALLVVLAVVTYTALRWDRTDHGATVPAAVGPTATPTPRAVSGVLVEVALPAEALPAGLAGSSLAHFTLPSGARTTWLAPHNALLAAVLDGTLVVRSGDPIQVLRVADGAWEAIPGGAEVSLGPGDLVLLLDVATAEFDNPGDVPLELLLWGLASGSETEPPMPPEWVTNDYALSAAGAPSLPGNTGLFVLPGREGRLRLETVVLESNSSLPPAPTDVLRMVVAIPTDNTAGTPVAPVIARRSDGRVDVFGAQVTTLYVVTLAIAGGAGTPIVHP